MVCKSKFEHYIIENDVKNKNLVSINRVNWFDSINDLIAVIINFAISTLHLT